MTILAIRCLLKIPKLVGAIILEFNDGKKVFVFLKRKQIA